MRFASLRVRLCRRCCAPALIAFWCCTGIIAQQPLSVACQGLTEAQTLIRQQRWQQAAVSLRSALAAEPRCPESRYLLGYVLLRTNQPNASLEEYTEAAKLRPPNSEDFTAVASDYILLKAYPDAQRWLLRAVETPPISPQAWYLLGRTQYNLDLNAAAVKSFQQSLVVLPEDVRSEYNLGLAYERLQQPDLARDAYQQAIRWSEQKNGTDAQPYLDLGILDRVQGLPQQALPLLQKAASLSTRNPMVFQELGRTLADLHRPQDAITSFEKAIQLAPQAEAPHFFLGHVYRAVGRNADAKEQFRLAEQLLTGAANATPNTDRP